MCFYIANIRFNILLVKAFTKYFYHYIFLKNAYFWAYCIDNQICVFEKIELTVEDEYWLVFKNKLILQNLFLLIASYIFYGWWDWRFLSLIFASSIIDFTIGILLGKYQTDQSRKAIITVSIITNLGLLGFFKYFNFFIASFIDLLKTIGIQANETSLRIILPVGISFYTFQSLSYTIDVYRKKLEPTHDIVSFLSFVSFFPQLVAGPIERATNLLPQFHKKRNFTPQLASDGLRQMLWGFFKKIVIADNCAIYVNDIFTNFTEYSGSTLLLGSILFAFQIYCDFSGYSDIAIGTARLFGFSLMRNFAFPYFSRDIAEFWRKWHISLTTWFRDYLYIPLGGSRVSNLKVIRNTFIVFLVSGFWHGANWTFIIWGLIHACYFMPLLLFKRNRKNLALIAHNRIIPSIVEVTQMLSTFLLVCLAWVFFRSETTFQSFAYLKQIFSKTLFAVPDILPLKLIFFICILILMEWFQREKQHALKIEDIRVPSFLRWGVYYLIIFAIIWFGGNQQDFIYFQF